MISAGTYVYLLVPTASQILESVEQKPESIHGLRFRVPLGWHACMHACVLGAMAGRYTSFNRNPRNLGIINITCNVNPP